MSDFTNVVDVGGVFTEFDSGSGVDFLETGDYSSAIIFGGGFGEGGFGEGPFGGTKTVVISVSTTPWTNIETS